MPVLGVVFDFNGTLSDDEPVLCEIFMHLFAQPQKSKSSSEIPSWIDPHSVHPYFDISPQSRARATLFRSGRP